MGTMMDFKSKSILKNQRALFAGIIFIILILSFIFYHTNSQNDSQSVFPVQSKVELPSDKINPQEIWMSRLDNENKILKSHIDFIEKTILEIKKSHTETIKENDELKKEVINLQRELKKASENIKKEENTIFRPAVSDFKKQNFNEQYFSATEEPFLSSKNKEEKVVLPSRSIFKEVVSGKAKTKILHVDKAIPAGTSVKAILVSSVDAPCGIYSKSDPQPIKLRIIDNGHLPKEVEAQLKGGLIIASAYGDISTERIYVRIERLTKVKQSGEFIETSVTGFVSGEDGKFGIRGSVVDKSEKIIANAAKSGFLGGIGGILQSAVSKHEVNQFSFDVVKQGCASGASSAFDMLADYYIKRAEQVMPVIQVTAGRTVDITFTHQADLGDLYTKEKVKEIRDSSRK